MVIHDLQCDQCDERTYDMAVDPTRLPACPSCHHPLTIWYGVGRRRGRQAAVDPKERAVVFHNPKTGSIAYPGRNDQPMAARYADNGYQKVEMNNLRELDTFCKQNNLMNHKANFDEGSGNANEY